MGFVAQFSTPSQTELIGKMTENAINKIPEYAREYKREYQFIRGMNKDFKYLINKLDNLNNGLFESNISNRIKYNIKRFLRGQEKGKLKDISEFALPKYDYIYIQDFYIYNEFEIGDNPSYKKLFDLIEKLYNKIRIELVFSDCYGEEYCI